MVEIHQRSLKNKILKCVYKKTTYEIIFSVWFHSITINCTIMITETEMTIWYKTSTGMFDSNNDNLS